MRKTMRKMLTGLLAAAMAASCLLTASAAETMQISSPGDETAKVTESVKDVAAAPSTDGTVANVNTSKKGNATLNEIEKTAKKSVTVDSNVTVNGVSYAVTKIGADAFAKCTKMTSVTLPSSIETIAKNAFSGAKKLKKAKLEGEPAVKGGALKGAAKLTTLEVTGKATFEKAAFKGTKLKKITLGKNGATFAKGAFKGADTKNTVIEVPKNMSAKKLKKLQKELAAAGFKGKIKKV